jgi:hypothetical protein
MYLIHNCPLAWGEDELSLVQVSMSTLAVLRPLAAFVLSMTADVSDSDSLSKFIKY